MLMPIPEKLSEKTIEFVMLMLPQQEQLATVVQNHLLPMIWVVEELTVCVKREEVMELKLTICLPVLIMAQQLILQM